MDIRDEVKEAILGGHLYDFLSNNEHRLSKHEVIEIAKNLDFTAYETGESGYKRFCNNVVNNLADVDFFGNSEVEIENA